MLLIMLLLQSSLIFPQDTKPGKESPDSSQAGFKLSMGVVVVNATVTDKKGAAVTDLAPQDFRIYEDGKLQQIETFALETYKSIQDAAVTTGKPFTEAPAAMEPSLSRPRMISLIIDDVVSAPEDRFLRVSQAIANFLEKNMEPGDKVALLSASGRVHVPFSGDKQLLLSEVANLNEKLNWSPLERSECPVLTDLMAQRIYNNRIDAISLDAVTEETIRCLKLNPPVNPIDADVMDERIANFRKMAQDYARQAATVQYQELIFRNRDLLQALRRHLSSLRYLDGVKNVILFSDGFLQNDLIFELQDVVEQALRSGTVLNSINMRGLFNPLFMPASDRTTSATNEFLRKSRAVTEDVLAQENPLHQLAYETGGIYFHNNNNLYEGIRQICDRSDYYYVLTYAIPPQKPDGRFHSIKVEVLRPGLQISHRKGYYAPKEEITYERQKKEDILQALYAPGNLNEIPMSLAYNYYQDDDTTYVVSLLIKIGIRSLHFFEEDLRHRNLIHMAVVAFDETDRYVKGLEKSVDFRLTDTSYASILDSGITSKLEFKLPIGRYRIRAIVREASQGKMGSLTKAIEIP